MNYKFDRAGWYTTSSEFADRFATIRPTTIPTKRTVGQNYPNWTGYSWIMIPYETPVVDEVVVPIEPRRISRLAFLNRFTDAEAVALDLASIGATVQAASIRRYMSKVNAAEYIDLNRDDTRAGVIALETNGMISAGRAIEILDAAVAEHEKFKG